MVKEYTIYGKNQGEKRVEIATVTGEHADRIIDMLFDYQEWTEYEIFFDTLWAEGEDDENRL